jgi:hypothetical protein
MATHDASSGSGGVDGSIAYELDRDEVCLVLSSPTAKVLHVLIVQNFGLGFTDTLSDFVVYPNKYVSRQSTFI